jgi:tRNA pseudouridine38-40 synthase
VSGALQRLKLVIAYDGRPFNGWQSQTGGGGIQDHIEAAAEKIAGVPVRLHGSGRTDAGVHALGQVAHFDVALPTHPPDRWQIALNANLPPEIRVLRVARARGGREGFHARFSATGKRYVYRVWNDRFLHPMEIGRAWLVPHELDFDALREGTRLLTGRHDFAGFAANRGTLEKDTVRTIHDIRISRRGPLVTLTFEGDGFLYKMVRLLTGSLIRIAQGRGDTAWLRSILDSVAQKTQFAAPAEGLFLARVFYR